MPSEIATRWAEQLSQPGKNRERVAAVLEMVIQEACRPLVEAVKEFANGYSKELTMGEHARLWLNLLAEARKLKGGG